MAQFQLRVASGGGGGRADMDGKSTPSKNILFLQPLSHSTLAKWKVNGRELPAKDHPNAKAVIEKMSLLPFQLHLHGRPKYGNEEKKKTCPFAGRIIPADRANTFSSTEDGSVATKTKENMLLCRQDYSCRQRGTFSFTED